MEKFINHELNSVPAVNIFPESELIKSKYMKENWQGSLVSFILIFSSSPLFSRAARLRRLQGVH